MRTKFASQYDNKLLEGILDYMAQEMKGEFGFDTLDKEDQLDIIALFVDNPTSYETPYLHSIECDSIVISTKDITEEEIKDKKDDKEMSNVELLKRLSGLM
tara:strand:+ start:375 stop:677 length:303 start_codon:yes stop_codon:yes gene_type:complete